MNETEALLIHGLEEAGAHGAMYVENRPSDSKGLVSIEQRVAGVSVHTAKLYRLGEKNNTRTRFHVHP